LLSYYEKNGRIVQEHCHILEAAMSAYLHHIQIGATDPGALASFYEHALDMRARQLSDGRYLVESRDRRLVFAPGAAKHLDFVAYAFTEAADLAAVTREFPPDALEPSPSPVFGNGAFSVRDPDGNRIVLGLADDLAAASEAVDMGGMPARLQHLVVASPRCAAMERFFVDALGFAVSDRVCREDGSLMTTFLRSSDEHHSFAVFQAAKSGLDHHCYETPDWNAIRDWADRFAKLKIPLSWGPGRHGPGNNLFIFINDPEGNWLEFSAELEIVDRGRVAGIWPHAERTLNLWGRAPLRN
jgi:catechol 2,3-dioxygenase-like lactoylglutathione lyase family enzyme